MKMTAIGNRLSSIYYDPANPAGFSSVDKLFRQARLSIPNLTLKDVKIWLSKQIPYTLHKQVRRNFDRNKVFVHGIGEQFQADLVDMKASASLNKNNNFILTCIDVFSKYAWAIPIKNKSGISVKNALNKILDKKTCGKLQTDRGLEFKNSTVQNMLKERNIHYFTSFNSKFKCSVVERFNRTLKGKMFKYFTATGKQRYIDRLQDMVDAYNNTVHRSIKMKPSEVNDHNEQEVFYNLYGVATPDEYLSKQRKGKTGTLPNGQFVRRAYELSLMDKRYYPNWTDQIYKIIGSTNGLKPMYQLENDAKEVMPQRFYPEEIQAIGDGQSYRVSKVLKTRINNGIRESLVKFTNFPNHRPQWVTDIWDINQHGKET